MARLAYIGTMIRLRALVLALCLAPLPVLAQESDPDPGPDPDGRFLMERGVELFFEGLREEMSPAMDELRGLAEEFGPSMRSFLQEMGPALSEMFEEVKDWTAYHPPEMLPNGDIIIRKRQPEAEPETEPQDDEDAPQGPTDI